MASKISGPEQVAAFFDSLAPPLKDGMLLIREMILSADDSITEHIKWKAPSFMHGGDDRITFQLHRNGTLMLIFHRGATVKDGSSTAKLIDDPTGLLDWIKYDRASITINDLAGVDAIRDDLQNVVRLWIAAASAG